MFRSVCTKKLDATEKKGHQVQVGHVVSSLCGRPAGSETLSQQAPVSLGTQR